VEKFKFIKKENLSKLPQETGVYSFFEKKNLLYIGKATNIRERVKNHFQQPTYRDDLYINRITKIGYIKTGSEIEALLLEADLIKKHQPKFNVVWRDDKNYFFVAMTKEAFPQIFITHQIKKQSAKNKLQAEYAGPFVDGRALKETLKFLRKVFPYRSCRFLPKKSCLWYHLDRCPAPCALDSNIMDVPAISKKIEKEAQKDASLLFRIIQGKKSLVLGNLKREMKAASKDQNFEIAKKIRDKIASLGKTFSNAKIFERYVPASGNGWQKTSELLQKITNCKKQISKIEAYDISNMQGKEATGSEVAFVEGKSDKSMYRKFKIQREAKPNDIAMIKEILTRRFLHKEWGLPDIILIDGGKAQLNAAIEIKRKQAETKNIPVISLAKKHNELFVEGKKIPILLKSLPKEVYDIILQLRDEAHRFAISYHKNLRFKALLPR
jgi:excinuclease ABC subunit C